MKRTGFDLILLFFLCPAFALAQELPVSQDPAMNTPPWQLTLDVIKSKAQVLIDVNNKLMAEHDSLVGQQKQVMVDTRDLQMKNEDLKKFLKERHGKSDQQIKIDDLTEQINRKKQDHLDSEL